MVLMTVGNDQRFDFFMIFDEVGVIRYDIVHAKQVSLGEHDTAVDDDNLIVMFEAVHVFTDFTKTAQGIYKRVGFMINHAGIKRVGNFRITDSLPGSSCIIKFRHYGVYLISVSVWILLCIIA